MISNLYDVTVFDCHQRTHTPASAFWYVGDNDVTGDGGVDGDDNITVGVNVKEFEKIVLGPVRQRDRTAAKEFHC